MRIRFALLWICLVLASSAHAESLMEIYRLAEQEDPQFAAAMDELAAQRTLNDQARGVLLPNLDLVGGYTENWRDIESEGQELGPGTPPIDQSGDYQITGWNYGLQLRQPLFNMEAFERLDQARSQVALAELQFALARQDLILRVAQRYFAVLRAERQLATATAQREAIEEQLAQARRSFEVGTVSVTDVDEAQAAYDAAVSQELAQHTQLAITRQQLASLIGRPVDSLMGVRGDIALTPPSPSEAQSWVKQARDGNLAMLAQRKGVDVARSEVDARKGRAWPSVALVAGSNVQRQESPQFTGNEVTESKVIDNSIGVQLSMPLFTGGLRTAQIQEAAHQYNKAKDQLVGATRQAELQARQAYLQLTNSIVQVRALRQSVRSAHTALESTRVGHEVGVRTQVDVLNALQRLYGAQRDLYGARYDYLLARLNLQAAVGGLQVDDLASIGALLNESVMVDPGPLPEAESINGG